MPCPAWNMFWCWFVSMVRYLNIILLIILAIVVQSIILPAYLAEDFRPSILLIVVVYLGFRTGMRVGIPASFTLGLIQDTLSGIYFGLNGFTYLLVFLLYYEASERLYTGSRLLMMLGAFMATLITALAHLVLLIMFSASAGVYTSILGAVIPQALMNTVVSGLLFRVIPFAAGEEKTT